MKNQQFIGLLLVAVTFATWTMTLADHCGDDATAYPNDTAPDHICICKDPNKQFSDCASICPKTCSNWWEPISCQACKPGCECKDGLVLDKNNRCVKTSKCPKPVCDDPHREFTEHGNVCPPACPGVNDDKVCTYQFVPGCFCRRGLLEDGHGNCVPPSCCPTPECKDPRREYDECGTRCPPTCQNLNETSVQCTIEACFPGCFCKYPFVEDINGNCVDPSKCPKPVCSDPNRHYGSCGTACPRTCENKDALILCTDDCVSGCFCNKGLVEDENGKCVKPEDCPDSTVEIECVDPNREYLTCGSACPTTCENLHNPPPCIDVCVEGCFCKPGLIDDGNGNCINPKDCGRCQDPNKFYTDCGTACPITCDNWWYHDNITCTEQCVQGCFCRPGLVEDNDGNCVESNQCPTPVCNDPNREFNECGSSCPDSCDNINNPDRVCTLQCVPDCFCKPPLIEDGNGNCIDRSACPNPTCPDPNRYYTDCGTRCPLTCRNRCKEFGCAAVCTEGCFCLPWLIDNGYGKCIYPEDCPADACECDGNAVWEECGSCDGTCSNPDPYCPAVCTQGCFCQDGWVRNDQNVCIPRRRCPRTPRPTTDSN